MPSGAKSVTIRLEGPADKTLHLRLRHEKPVQAEKVEYKVVVEMQTESQRLLMVFKREQ